MYSGMVSGIYDARLPVVMSRRCAVYYDAKNLSAYMLTLGWRLGYAKSTELYGWMVISILKVL